MTPRLWLLAPAALLAACDAGGPDDTVSQADVEPQSAPGAPGISEEALDTNRVFSVLGQHARNLENASDADAARESLGEFVAAFEAGTAELPADLVGRLRDHVVIAQQAIEGGNLEAAKAAGQSMIVEMREVAPAGGPV